MIEMLRSIPKTFYSKRFYWHLFNQSQGIGMGFIVVLVLLGVLGIALRLVAPAVILSQQIDKIVAALPEATMKNHMLSINAPSPYKLPLFEAEKEPNMLVIDTSYPISNLDDLAKKMKEEKILMLITGDKIVTAKQQGLSVQVDDMGKMPDGKITRDEWAAYGKTIRAWLYPGFFLGITIVEFMAKFILTLVTSAIMLGVAALMNAKTDFNAIMRVTAAAGVPVAIIGVLISVPFLVMLLIWIGFAIFGIGAAQKSESAEV